MARKDRNGKFNTALLDYVRRGSVELLQLLLRNDNPDLIDREGKTLLHHAAESNNVSMTRHFINNNYDVDVVDNRGNSPLMLAVEEDSYDTAKLLVEAGANIYLMCSDDAAGILSNKPNQEADDDPALDTYHEFVKVIVRHLKKDCGNDEQLLLTRLRDVGCTLFQVISLGDAKVTRLMLGNGYSVDERDLRTKGTALHRAVYLGDFENVKVLLEFSASVDALDEVEYPPLHYLFHRPSDSGEDEEERVEIMKILIEHGALSNKTPDDPIEHLLRYGGSRAITALVQLDVDINYYAALSSLVDNVNDDALEVLGGINVDVNRNYILPLISRAVFSGSIKKVQFLLERGADPNAVDVVYEKTPLMNAFTEIHSDAQKNVVSIVQLLLQYGADAQHFMTDENQEKQTVFDMENTKVGQDCSLLRQQSLESIIAHLAMIESCGESISDLIRQKIDSRDAYKQHFQLCKQQIEEMKNAPVNGSVTLYKLLTESHLRITRYARNPQFTPQFEEVMKVKSYLDPYFSISLHERVGEAIQEAKLKEEAIVVMHKIFPCCFRNCTEIFSEILDYLTCDDYKNICKVYDVMSPNLPT